MKDFTKQSLFPWLTLLAGLVGLALRFWLFSCEDNRGLLPDNHIAGTLLHILFVLMAVILCLVIRKADTPASYGKLFPASRSAAIAGMASAVGMGISSFTLSATGVLRILTILTGILWAIGLLLAAFCRLQKHKPHLLCYGLGVVFFALRAILCYRMFGSEPQLQQYLFEMLASVALLLTSYYRAELTVSTGNRPRYMFCCQIALLCSCVCLAGQDRIFWLSACIWLASECCALSAPKGDA